MELELKNRIRIKGSGIMLAIIIIIIRVSTLHEFQSNSYNYIKGHRTLVNGEIKAPPLLLHIVSIIILEVDL